MPPRPKLPLAEQTETSLAPDPSDPPSTALATIPEMGLALAQAELAALQDMAEQVAVQLLGGLAEMRQMSVPELLTAIRVAKTRLDTLQTIVLQQAVLA